MKRNWSGSAFLHVLGVIVDTLVLVVIVAAGALGIYCLWDTQNVVARADSANYAVYRPDDRARTPSYDDLIKINPETVGWLTLYGTKVDYPLVQGDDNEKYLSCDALGNFSMSGALYLDCRAAADFSDFATVIYGHHMDADAMFGSLDDFQDPTYFAEHEYGDLFYGGTHHGLHILAVVPIEDVYSSPLLVQPLEASEGEGYMTHLRADAQQWRELEVTPHDHLVVMSTCHSDSTNGRLAVVARIDNQTYPDSFGSEIHTGTGLQNSAYGLVGWLCSWWWLLLLIVALTALLIYWRRSLRRAAAPTNTTSHSPSRSSSDRKEQ